MLEILGLGVIRKRILRQRAERLSRLKKWASGSQDYNWRAL